MFDRIAHRYDLLNQLLSLGRDAAWRKQFARNLPQDAGLRVLDLATGTADVLITLAKDPRVISGIGLDMSWEMLRHGHQKLARLELHPQFSLLRGDATCQPLASASFDLVTIAFGIRNVTDVTACLKEMLRILKPGGRALILEFSLPKNLLFRALYLAYFRHVLPRIGGFISGDASAYRYLNATVETFPYGDAFLHLMIEAGFAHTTAHPLTFGIATLYQGHKE